MSEHSFPAEEIWTKIIKTWILHGHTGVSLFLVLSAFLFTLICSVGERKIHYRKFIYNRILRIFPLILVIIFIVITVSRGVSTPLDILRVLTLQLNTGNPHTGWGQEFFPSGPIWTIAVEFQFYLLFPFLILFSNRYGMKWLMLSVLFVVLIRLLVVSLNDKQIYFDLYHSIIGRLDQFLVGIIAGIIYLKLRYLNIRNIHLSILLISSFAILTYLLHNNDIRIQSKYMSSVFQFLLEGILWASIIICYMMIKIPDALLLNRISKILAWLGSLSFSIYLLHLPVGEVITRIFILLEPNSLLESIYYNLIRLPFIIFISIVAFYSVEKPFMELRVKYLES
ncbi:acyltransferase [Actinobacillus genomosp. 1]|nr:acyltransferase [Actinobacillus genomosp. 1]WGE36989.1 acyltransferase [Actinobacillus genomosp. 1]